MAVTLNIPWALRGGSFRSGALSSIPLVGLTVPYKIHSYAKKHHVQQFMKKGITRNVACNLLGTSAAIWIGHSLLFPAFIVAIKAATLAGSILLGSLFGVSTLGIGFLAIGLMIGLCFLYEHGKKQGWWCCRLDSPERGSVAKTNNPASQQPPADSSSSEVANLDMSDDDED